MSTKDTIIEMLRTMPDDVTWAEIVAEGTARVGSQGHEAEESLTQEEWESAWLEECNRRLEDMRSGKSVSVPAEDVMRRLKEKYG